PCPDRLAHSRQDRLQLLECAATGTSGHSHRPKRETSGSWVLFPCCAFQPVRSACQQRAFDLEDYVNRIDVFAKSLFFIGVIDVSYASAFANLLSSRSPLRCRIG